MVSTESTMPDFNGRPASSAAYGTGLASVRLGDLVAYEPHPMHDEMHAVAILRAFQDIFARALNISALGAGPNLSDGRVLYGKDFT